MKKMRCLFCIFLALLLLLPSCKADNSVTYEPGTNGEGSVIIHGYDAQYLEYTASYGGVKGFLYFVNPRFLGDAFADGTVEGDASLEEGVLWVNLTLLGADQGLDGTNFRVDVDAGTVASGDAGPWSLTEEQMVELGGTLVEIIQNAERACQTANA